ncbi:MAG TPA: hypothetical protein VML75_13285 [Kofleriaceae bacterium]|nr:hypothetical protein [Kofleriaceae bacterium]
MTGAYHVAFVADAELLERAAAAMASYERDGDSRPLDEVLAAARHARWRHRAQERGILADAARREIERHLGGDAELLAALRAAPAQVRAAAARELAELAPRLARLRVLGVPPIVVQGTRTQVVAMLAALDPASAFPEQPDRPPLPMIEGPAGEDVVNLHGWLCDLLEVARRDGGGLVGLGGAVADLGGARALILDEVAGPVAPGIELTMYGIHARDRRWTWPAVVLPRPLRHRALIVVGVAGGPASFAVAGDVTSAALDPALAARVHALVPGEALVSFVAVTNDIEWPWCRVDDIVDPGRAGGITFD